MHIAEILLDITLPTAGIVLLRQSWLARGAKMLALFGWGMVVAGVAMLAMVWGAEIGAAYGLLVFSVAGYIVVGAGAEVRLAHARAPGEVALSPEERPTNWTRGIAKSLLAIVLAGVAAIGIGVAFAVTMPMSPQDSIVIGGLLVPVLWGGGMAWPAAGRRRGRPSPGDSRWRSPSRPSPCLHWASTRLWSPIWPRRLSVKLWRRSRHWLLGMHPVGGLLRLAPTPGACAIGRAPTTPAGRGRPVPAQVRGAPWRRAPNHRPMLCGLRS